MARGQREKPLRGRRRGSIVSDAHDAKNIRCWSAEIGPGLGPRPKFGDEDVASPLRSPHAGMQGDQRGVDSRFVKGPICLVQGFWWHSLREARRHT